MTLQARILNALPHLWKTQDQLQTLSRRYADNPDSVGLDELRASMSRLESQALNVGMLLARWQGEVELTPESEVLDEAEPSEDENLAEQEKTRNTPDELSYDAIEPEDYDYFDCSYPPIVTATQEAVEHAEGRDNGCVEHLVEVEPPKPPDLSLLKQWAAGKTNPAEGILPRLLDSLGEPRRVMTLDQYRQEIQRLARITGDFTDWIRLPHEEQRALTGLVAARARHLQDEAGPELNHPYLGEAMNRLFSNLTAYSADARPGFVFGLSRGHTPVHGTWLEDACMWWARLHGETEDETDDNPIDAEDKPSRSVGKALNALEKVAGLENPDPHAVITTALECLDLGLSASNPRIVKLLQPHLGLLTRERKLKGVRKAIRDYEKELRKEADSADKDISPLPNDWPFWKYTEGKKIAIVGGDKRDTTIERFRVAFKAASVEWESGWQVRRVEALAQRIQSGNIDMVILLARFMSHQAWYILVPPCKEARVPFVLVERGYGLSQVRSAVEMVLERWDGGDNVPA